MSSKVLGSSVLLPPNIVYFALFAKHSGDNLRVVAQPPLKQSVTLYLPK